MYLWILTIKIFIYDSNIFHFPCQLDFNLDRPKSGKSFTRTHSKQELIVTKVGDLDDDDEDGGDAIDVEEGGVSGRASKMSSQAASKAQDTIQITTKSETIALSRAASSPGAAGETVGGTSVAAGTQF